MLLYKYIYGLSLSYPHPSFVDFNKQEYCAVLTLRERPLSIFMHCMVDCLPENRRGKKIISEQRKLHYGCIMEKQNILTIHIFESIIIIIVSTALYKKV